MFNGNTSQDFAALDELIDESVFRHTPRYFIAQALSDYHEFYNRTYGPDFGAEIRAMVNSVMMFLDAIGEEQEHLREAITIDLGLLRQRARPLQPYTKAKIDRQLRKKILERDAYRCRICNGWKDLSVDHIFPEALGGTLHPANLRTLCRKCNSRKGIRYARSTHASAAD